MKIKCKECNNIIENKDDDKEVWCSCKNLGLFNDYILYGNSNKLKKDSYIDLTPKKALKEVIKELNKLENNRANVENQKSNIKI